MKQPPPEAEKTFDVEDSKGRFRFSIEAFVLGRPITAIEVKHDKVSIAIGDDRMIAFSVDGPNVAISITAPAMQYDGSPQGDGTVQ